MKRFFAKIELALGIAVLAGTPAFSAEVVQELNTREAFGGPDKIFTKGDGYLEITHGVPCIGVKTFDIDPGKTYTISGEFRCAEVPKNGRLYIGFRPRTAAGKDISFCNAISVNAAIGTLAAPVKKGDKSVKIKGVSAWKITAPHYMLAMNAKEDRSDLPNFDLSPKLLKAPGKAAGDDVLEFALQRPFGKAYPEGTCVRLHSSGEIHIFVSARSNPRKLSTEWQSFSGKISANGKKDIRAWYPGAVKAAGVIYPTVGIGKLQFRNVRITAE